MLFRKRKKLEDKIDQILLKIQAISKKLDHSIAMEEQMSEDIKTINKILIKSPN